MSKNFAELAECIDAFMFDYDYYGYADDVGISGEERMEHIDHLESALRNNEFSPMIDTFKGIVNEESLSDKKDVKQLEQAKGILKDLTEISKDFSKIEPWTPVKFQKESSKIKSYDDLSR